MTEYKTLEQQIIELWKTRDMDVETIKVQVKDDKGIWTIVAPVKKKPKIRSRGTKTTKGSVSKWMWRCPYEGCNCQGLRLQSHGRAGRHGRMHLKKKHNDTFSQPILERIA